MAKSLLHKSETNDITKPNEATADILEQMKNFRPPATIFEIGNTTKNEKMKSVMSIKRKKHSQVIDKVKLSQTQNNLEVEEEDSTPSEEMEALTQSTQDDINSGRYTYISFILEIPRGKSLLESRGTTFLPY